ncbi:beta-ketoacyl-ACP synthase III [Streptomyces aureocirculatus]|uniref:beta-ketoacyl-ACP synthase III n=1 Tax=Streptomyces aureocirculatus TaxID=67275 RepID=UPI00056554FE|nr:beta-ketoacyl-ACP synthase III [Streptomyces aureocirculatus]
MNRPLRVADPSPGSRILGVGSYRPTRVVDNAVIARAIDSTDEWITRRTGITSRRHAGPDETIVTMAAEACQKALAAAGVDADGVDMVLLASMSNLQQSPPAAPRVAHLVGARNSGAMDTGAACAGFSYTLGVADALVRSGAARHVLVVGAERMSDIIDPHDRGTAFLFGDGAGAVVVGASDRPGIGPVAWGAEGEKAGLLAHNRSWLAVRDAPHPWPTMRMDGPKVFRWAVHSVPDTARRALDLAGLRPADLDAFIPHQANLRIIDGMVKDLGLPDDVVVAREIVTLGNTSAASIPMAMESVLSLGSLPTGSRALLVGFGAGLLYAAQVVELP